MTQSMLQLNIFLPNAIELEKAVGMQNGNHAGSKKHDHKLSHVTLLASVETQCDTGICYCRNLARDTTCALLHHNLVSLLLILI